MKMNEQNFDVNKLSVAKPCSMSWENMSGDEKTRLCNACDMNIYNLSKMTSQEITSLIQNREGRLCGRIYKRTDGTVMTKDCPVGLRAYRKKISHFAGAAFTAILSLFSVGFGQTDSKTVIKKETTITRQNNQNQESILFGTIMDQFGALVPNAEIIITGNDNEFKATFRSSDNGEFKISIPINGTYKFEVKSAGFESYIIEKLKINKNEDIKLSINLQVSGEVVGIFFETYDKEIEATQNDISSKITLRSGNKIPVSSNKSVEKNGNVKITRIVNQNNENSIKGIVTDSNGAVIPNAKIILRKKNSKFKKKTKSSDEGNFEIKKIPSGEYELEIKAEHFKLYKNSNLIITKNKTVELNVELEVEDVSVTVGIFASEPLIDMSESGITHTISGETLRKLPINE